MNNVLTSTIAHDQLTDQALDQVAGGGWSISVEGSVSTERPNAGGGTDKAEAKVKAEWKSEKPAPATKKSK